ncbi:MAG: hypothetical protein H3C47_16265 [Candidatus Cloacimonetes bacterium]|nr:hypothetical protein [Candidatus Cloacimonadota bacterium]
MSDKIYQPLRRLGEDAAYTFKGLHKQADWLILRYKICLCVPIVFSIVSLGFDDVFNGYVLKCLATVSLIASVFALIWQRDFEKSRGYRELADKIKIVYDRAEAAFCKESLNEYDELLTMWSDLRQQLKDFPIESWAYRKAQKTIKQEMNLTWLGGDY